MGILQEVIKELRISLFCTGAAGVKLLKRLQFLEKRTRS